MSMKKLDKIVSKMYDNIQIALDKACPMISVSDQTKGSHWATEEHELVKKKVSRLFSIAKQTGSAAAWVLNKETSV